MTVSLGAALLLGTLFPLGGYLAQLVMLPMQMRSSDGAMGRFPMYMVISTLLIYLPWAIGVGFLLRRHRVVERVSTRFQSRSLFIWGTTLGFGYIGARLFAASVPGGGGGFAVAAFAPFVLNPALLMLLIATCRYVYGIDRDKLEHSER